MMMIMMVVMMIVVAREHYHDSHTHDKGGNCNGMESRFCSPPAFKHLVFASS